MGQLPQHPTGESTTIPALRVDVPHEDIVTVLAKRPKHICIYI